MFDGANWTSWTHADGLGAPNRRELPASGNTGLGTKARPELSIYVDGHESYNPNYAFAAKVDFTGRGVWFGTWGGGASLFDGESSWTSFTKEDGLPGNVVYSIAQQPDGLIWFGTDNGVASYDGEAFRTYPLPSSVRHIYSLAVSPDGSVWAGSRGSVLRLFEEGQGQ